MTLSTNSKRRRPPFVLLVVCNMCIAVYQYVVSGTVLLQFCGGTTVVVVSALITDWCYLLVEYIQQDTARLLLRGSAERHPTARYGSRI